VEYFIEIIYLIVMRVLWLKEDLEDALKIHVHILNGI